MIGQTSRKTCPPPRGSQTARADAVMLRPSLAAVTTFGSRRACLMMICIKSRSFAFDFASGVEAADRRTAGFEPHTLYFVHAQPTHLSDRVDAMAVVLNAR
jgi:hypothetical protein